jgi:Nif-specific regulatory protein
MIPSETRRLSELLALGQALGSAPNLRSALARAVDGLVESHAARVATVALLDEASRELTVEAAAGVALTAARKARYRLGEGITGKVVESGRPVVVPQVSREPLFLDRTGFFKQSRRELSYVCVPVPVEGKPAGALGVGLAYQAERDFDREVRFFEIVATLIGQAIRVHRLVQTERRRLLTQNQQLQQELRERHGLGSMVGNSRAMQQVYEQVAQLAPTSTAVLVRGESGAGKELLAHAIHYASPRARRSFVKVACAGRPEGLVEAELFGREAAGGGRARGAQKGRLELAQGGTLFLDEVGELGLGTQAKLLRVLRDREIERLGGMAPVKADVRLVAATSTDLETAVQAGSFRKDLYQGLAVFSIFLPPLRERKPDILLLADHFVEKYARAHGRDVRRIATSAIDMLMAYHWPGNVRELENCIERAVLVCEAGVIHAHHLPPTLQTAEVSGTLPEQSLAQAVAAYEKDLIQDALKSARGNRAKAARLLGTTERIIGYKIRKHRVDPIRFRR